ncbi:MAG: hypothetical protein WCJ30_22915, partial [Deltaproteobacteria bacterium]
IVGTTCPAGTGDCDHVAANGCEHDVTSDPANCGACGFTCSFPNAAATCALGACAPGTCNPGFADCDGNPANGCEVNLQTDPTHCGSCATACSFPNAAASCTAGVCAVGACNPNYSNCDFVATNGCETDLRTSATDCGACGVTCTAGINANTVCSNSQCAYDCSPGFVDCDGSTTPGCEVSNGTDIAHCGLCATSCSATANGTSACAGGSCGFTCATGFSNCDGNPANGCEANGATDVNNCGACGAACRSYPHTLSTCAAGACAYACEAGWANCDASPVNGCERDINSDAANCGACGTQCSGVNTRCTAGACTFLCGAGTFYCNGLCVNLTNDRNNCGACGQTCSDNRTCAASSCVAISSCTSGMTPCGGTCVSTQTDVANCGACANACAVGLLCSAGVCVLPGDTCGRPYQLGLPVGPVTFPVNTTGATNSSGSCRSSTPDVFIAFTLARQEVVYVDSFATAAGGPVAQLRLLDTCLASGGCASNSCAAAGGGAQAQVYRVMAAGTHILEIDASTAGVVSITIQHIPIGTQGAVASLPLAATFTLSDTTAARPNTPATCGLGPDLAYPWPTCPSAAAGILNATVCGGATWDTALQLVNGTSTGGGCNDNVFACAPQSTLAATVSAG